MAGDTNSHETSATATIGDDIKLMFKCPKCQDSCAVEWKNLNKGMRCRKCNARIQIGRREVTSLPEHRDQYIHFRCPRCKHAGSIPKAKSVQGTECVACELPLHRGPDNRLYTAEELAKVLEAQAAPKQVGWLMALVSLATEATGKFLKRPLVRWPTAGLLVAAVAWLAVGGLGMLLSGGLSGPEALARKFTYACLDGMKHEPLAYLHEDPLQQAEFRRWKPFQFASIGANVRPKGVGVDVRVEVLQETPDTRVFEVIMQSDFFGERRHKQHWRLIDDQWWFDAATTIRSEIDGA